MRRSVTTILTFCMAATLTCKHIEAANPANAQGEKATDFTKVAKIAIPAVVSIKVKAKNSKLSDDQQEALDLFGDDFLQRFFGLPKGSVQNQEQYTVGQASGFIVHPDGTILTNSHVVKDASEILVTLTDGREYKGKVIGQDPNTDIAAVKIDGSNLPYLNLANSEDLEVGQWVVAIGNPLGLQASLTVGVVSATGRNNLDLARIEDFIQTDAAINRGNSGGPLLNLDGKVVGMNTAIVANMGVGFMGIGFAIPSNMLSHIMHELLTKGSVSRGFIGVALQTVDTDLAKAFGLDKPEGALISEVTKNSPAEKAGIRQGDVILRLNKQNINNIATLRNHIALMEPGTKINLTVLRQGRIIELPMEVGLFPSAAHLAQAASQQTELGFEVENLTPEAAKLYGFANDKGVVVSKVSPGSPAAWVDIKKGALILSVNHQKIENLQDFTAALKSSDKSKPTLLLIKQGNITRYVSIKVG